MKIPKLTLVLLFILIVVIAIVAKAHADTPSLAQVYNGKVLIGTAVEPDQLVTDGALIAHHYNVLVAENVMKPKFIQPKEGEFDFSGSDAIVNFAQQHNMKVRGHTFVWYRGMPDWWWVDGQGRPATRDLLLQRLRTHIETVMGRYKGQIVAWDVVNEVIDASQPNCLRNDRWFQQFGPDYIDRAFGIARAVDPSARLIMNDYSTTDPKKLACILRVVRDLKARNVPIDGVGHQMHIAVQWPKAESVDTTLSAISHLGLENQITEWDMSFYQNDTSNGLGDSPQHLRDMQAARYKELMRVFLNHHDIKMIVWWGFSDKHTFRNVEQFATRQDEPLLFDKTDQPKESFWAILNAGK